MHPTYLATKLGSRVWKTIIRIKLFRMLSTNRVNTDNQQFQFFNAPIGHSSIHDRLLLQAMIMEYFDMLDMIDMRRFVLGLVIQI